MKRSIYKITKIVGFLIAAIEVVGIIILIESINQFTINWKFVNIFGLTISVKVIELLPEVLLYLLILLAVVEFINLQNN